MPTAEEIKKIRQERANAKAKLDPTDAELIAADPVNQKTRITMWIDTQMLETIKKEAVKEADGKYQVLIQRVLKERFSSDSSRHESLLSDEKFKRALFSDPLIKEMIAKQISLQLGK